MGDYYRHICVIPIFEFWGDAFEEPARLFEFDPAVYSLFDAPHRTLRLSNGQGDGNTGEEPIEFVNADVFGHNCLVFSVVTYKDRFDDEEFLKLVDASAARFTGYQYPAMVMTVLDDCRPVDEKWFWESVRTTVVESDFHPSADVEFIFHPTVDFQLVKTLLAAALDPKFPTRKVVYTLEPAEHYSWRD